MSEGGTAEHGAAERSTAERSTVEGGARPSALWLALGTFTALRVPPPATVDRRVAGAAMSLAPAAGVLLAVPAVAVVAGGQWLGAPSLLPAVLTLGLLALMTRALHLDGLADTADGLAASYDRQRALAVMRRGDTGPAGTATVVLVLLVQVAALAAATDRGRGPLAVVVAVVAGRAVVSMACARGIPAARPEGLGATMAQSVPVPAAIAVAATVTVAAAVAGTFLRRDGLRIPASFAPGQPWTILYGRWWLGAVAVVAGYAVAAVLLTRCVRRFGGVTGDVMGACVEAATATALVAVAVL